MKNYIKNMFLLQNKLNFDTNGEKWTAGITNKEKIINWERAITLELAECIDSFPWKHWKSIEQQPDIANARIELVDVWHFLMSSIIETQTYNLNLKHFIPELSDSEVNEINNKYELFKVDTEEILDVTNVNYQFIENTFKEFESSIYSAFSKYYEKEWTLNEHKEINVVLSLVEETIVASSLLNKYKLQFLSESSVEELYKVLEFTQRLTISFIASCSSLNLSFEDLNKQYLGKNALNALRQDKGYKEGTYIKMWNGEEDNVHMLRLIETLEEPSFESIYVGLDNIYKTL